jgi:hypothetical protein
MQAVLSSHCIATLCRCDVAVVAEVAVLGSGSDGLPPVRSIVHAGDDACAGAFETADRVAPAVGKLLQHDMHGAIIPPVKDPVSRAQLPMAFALDISGCHICSSRDSNTSLLPEC